MIGLNYFDAMDRTRKVVPTAVEGTKVHCKVYFQGGGYGGKTTLPRSLFTENREGPLSRYGFVLLSND
jgi:hypothetical protein